MLSNIKRFPEIDILKGIAVILMVIFHFFYIFYLVGKPLVNMDSIVLLIIATISHYLFILLFGVNLSISYQNNKDNKKKYFKKQLKRFGIFTFLSIVITLITYFAFPTKFVIFGIFHFFALSTLVSQLFIMNKMTTLLGMGLFLSAYIYITNNTSLLYTKCLATPLFCFITGFANINYSSIDHFNFIPFFSIVLAGMFIGQQIYTNGYRQINLSNLDKLSESKKNNTLNTLSYISKNSIPIYVIHWTILIAIVLISLNIQ